MKNSSTHHLVGQIHRRLCKAGFVVGALVGFAWGQKTKSRLGEAVRTDVSGGVVTVQLDTLQAAKAGLPDLLQNVLR